MKLAASKKPISFPMFSLRCLVIRFLGPVGLEPTWSQRLCQLFVELHLYITKA